MKLIGICLFAVTLLLSSMAHANAPANSMRPVPRGAQAKIQRLYLVPVYYTATNRPVPRPVTIGGKPVSTPVVMTRTVASQTTVSLVASRMAVSRSLRPILRPSNLVREKAPTAVTKTSMIAVIKTPKSIPTSKKGSICGVRKIRGQNMSSISGSIKGCGIKNPVRVTSVAGVPLSKAVTMDCGTAKALNHWVEKGAKPSVGRLGGGVAQVNMIAGYSCRTRNSKKGAIISEHGKGKAVDIAGVTLANGVFVSVLKGWGTKSQGKLLRSMHKSACGTFGTVLGPSADRYHRDHFHFDTASHRSGSYCK